MAKVEPFGGYSWKQITDLAHRYGAGPVTVYAKPPAHPYHLPDYMYPDLTGSGRRKYEAFLNQNRLVGVARAVHMWNKEAGIAIFRLVDQPEGADIVVDFSNDLENEWAAGEGKPGSVTIRKDQWVSRALAGHELGHALGLDHPDTPATRHGGDYADTSQLMSLGSTPSRAEAKLVRETYESNITPQIERMGPRHYEHDVPEQPSAPRPRPEPKRRKQQL